MRALFGAAGPKQFDAEVLAVVALIAAVLAIGLGTAGDYGIAVDEFNADAYGPKSLAWYTSGFTDRSSFTTVEETLWYYGPWFHILTALAQSTGVAEHWLTRHALTFLVGLAGIAALLPLARLAVGRWAGLVAIALCLTTGYLYGSLFFAPIDVPFLAAMTWATLAIVVMATPVVPTWRGTIAAGVFTGLAIATRSSGVIVHAYLLGAMVLCALEAAVRSGHSRGRDLMQIVLRTIAALAIAWATAIPLWPWLQIGNPFLHFKEAFQYFANHPNSFEFVDWGRDVVTTDLPRSYIFGQLAVRLPEGFLILLITGLFSGLMAGVGLLRACMRAPRRARRLGAATRVLTRSRGILVVWTAALLPIGFIIVQHSTLYDGVRHVMFVIPVLAVIAGCGFLRLLPLFRRWPVVATAIGGAHAGALILTLIILHPLEYIATNIISGGVHGAYNRFEQDYWSLAAQAALRRLEMRLDYENRFAANPPSLMICIGHREWLVQPMFRRPWRLEIDPAKADFLIETQRWPCAEKFPELVLIDEVKRFDRAFARTFVRPSSAAAAPPRAATPEPR